jgi:IclR family transcriptional regulator, mhp operon transcriptional activator
MASYKPINAVVRALDLLLALNRRPVSSIDSLHKETRIPKPTIVRLLETLAHRGMVRRGPRHGSYQITALVGSLSSGYHSEAKIVEAAGPVALRLTKEIKWPVGVATFDLDAMVIQYSTIPYSPLAPYHSVLNRRYSMVRNALGRAYLAYCSPAERDIILDMVIRNGDEDDARIARHREAVQRIVSETRALGYAVRHYDWQPESNSIAVPLFDGESLAASMSITWFRKALSASEAARRYAAPLKAAAKEIAERCV